MDNHLKECTTKKEKLFPNICHSTYILKMVFDVKQFIKQKDWYKKLLQGKEKKLILIFLHQQERKNYHPEEQEEK